ncbi:NAD(P)-dependent oxidoreductase [Ahrensia sp. R2A130]|uniref:NAD-dependent epimerase/dehydratase family protein n=1 Tax=Ahrensia sp. R2A130 TaxID=744979 RepID=UPI0001E0CA4D|nr:NAD-dependent epimerase/dehydratase family protein [Ahrensia sp. R2A130]EFL87639.1 putative NAD-dependent epimerase/dehydratase [Ahrensia sp. R2A130]
MADKMAPPSTRIMLTGASGALGAYVKQHLLEHNSDLGNDVSLTCITRQPLSGHDVAADLLDTDAMAALVEQMKPDAVIHLAWETTHGSYWTDPINSSWADASIALAKAVTRHGGWFGFAGTCAEYEWGEERLNVMTTPARPATLYGREKLRVTQALEEMKNTFAGRIFFPFSEKENENRITSVLLRKLTANEPLHLRAGDAWRDIAHADDIAASMVAACFAGLTGTHNLATGKPTHMGEFLRSIAVRFGKKDLVTWDDWETGSAGATEPRHLVAKVQPVDGVLPVACDLNAGIDRFLEGQL